MAFDGGESGMGFPVPMDPDMTDLSKLEDMQKQFVSSLEQTAQQMGLDPEQVRGQAEQLAPYQPMMEFVEKWQGEDGQWLGDPIQRSQEYVDALSEVGQRAMGGMFATLLSAAEQPPWDNPDTLPSLQGFAVEGPAAIDEVPSPTSGLDGYWTETTPEGSPGYTTGLDPYWEQANLDAVQGDEVAGFEGTCGLTSVANIANMFGRGLSEGDVIKFAAETGLCSTGSWDAGTNGGTSASDQAKLLEAAGVPAHAEVGRDLDDLAAYTEEGKGTILEVNAGVLWDDPTSYDGGGSNHAITLTGVVRDTSGEIDGFYVCDSGRQDLRRFVSADLMSQCWEQAGGNCVVTDVQRTQGYPPQYA